VYISLLHNGIFCGLYKSTSWGTRRVGWGKGIFERKETENSCHPAPSVDHPRSSPED
jgi:hypothetical protein